jgi:cob(I)alamin adenosyltransferase
MKIYTKTGDKGETGLFGGEHVSKDSPRISAYGTVDELNSFIGLAVTKVKSEDVKKSLLKIQNYLFTVGADLATPENNKTKKLHIQRTPSTFYEEMEKMIDEYEKQLDELKNFILPGGAESAALLHICRTICRRAEREAVALKKSVTIGDNIIIFLNRLSDLLFVLSRFENRVSNHPDTIWNPKSGS